jgi:hypothetical protein
MKTITISLSDGLFAELQAAAKATKEPGFQPADWATEVVAGELAARRLPRFTVGRSRPGGAVAPIEHRVLLPGKIYA